MKQIILVSSLFTIVFLLYACTSVTSQPRADEICTEPRPEICTMNYLPVCGVRIGHTSKTYSNGCSACSDSEVVGYNTGKCPQTCHKGKLLRIYATKTIFLPVFKQGSEQSGFFILNDNEKSFISHIALVDLAELGTCQKTIKVHRQKTIKVHRELEWWKRCMSNIWRN